MDWRLIAALSAAGGSFCLVAVGAYVVVTASPTQPRTYAPPPSLLSVGRPGNSGSGGTVASLTPNATPSAFAPRPAPNAGRPVANPGPGRVQPASLALSPAPTPSLVNAPSTFAPNSVEEVAPSPFAPSPFAPNYALPPEPPVTPTTVGVGSSPPALDLARPQEPPKPSLVRHEVKREHVAAPTGPKLASLTPGDVAPRHEPPPRPVVEVKKPTIMPEIHAAPPAARYQGVLTSTEVARIHRDLRLTPEQESRWPPVQAALGEMGRQQIQLIRQGQEPRISPNDWPPQRLYSVAGPLLMTLRPDQKDQVRRLCRSLGFEAVASML
jgi:hypothetical protein